MATYNGEKFIGRQLNSILDQLMVDDEVIISDDSSTDQTIEIIKKINDPRIHLLEKQKFQSPLLNFENALKEASGDFIFLSDQDDIWLPDKISRIIPLFNQYDLILSDCEVVNEKNEQLQESFFKYRNSKPGFLNNLYKNSYIGCCMAFRREVLTYALPFPGNIHMHDWWIGLLVEAKGQVCFYPKPLISYVRHGGNASPTGESGYGLMKQIYNRYILLLEVTKRLKM
jgi:glycosyltransferase involved in cell wall biosynthesis